MPGDGPIPAITRENHVTFERRSVFRGLYVGRLTLATVLFMTVVVANLIPGSTPRVITSLAFVIALAFTVASFVWTDLTQHEAGSTFAYLQTAFDMVLVTAAVHVTWSLGQSQVAPLYILIIAVSALLLPASGVPLIASFGMVLYFADAMLLHGGDASTALLSQLAVFLTVAITCAMIGKKLREAGVASEALAAELAEFRLRETDMRKLVVRAERLEGIAEMSASLAHEIKNPLASIRSAVEQLSRLPRATEDEKILGGLVQRESDRISRVLTQFLDFAKTGVAHVAPLDLVQICHHAAALAASQPGTEDGVKIVEFFPSHALTIEGDEDLMHRAIFNLLLNAVQASPPNREVRIEGGELLPHQLPEGYPEFSVGAYGIIVIDQGPGIAPQIRDRLFDPFVTTKPGGSGLGLSIVQRAVQAHGGIITVSQPGEETRFTIVLPKTRHQPS